MTDYGEPMSRRRWGFLIGSISEPLVMFGWMLPLVHADWLTGLPWLLGLAGWWLSDWLIKGSAS